MPPVALGASVAPPMLSTVPAPPQPQQPKAQPAAAVQPTAQQQQQQQQQQQKQEQQRRQQPGAVGQAIFGTTPSSQVVALPRLLGFSGRLCSPALMHDLAKKPQQAVAPPASQATWREIHAGEAFATLAQEGAKMARRTHQQHAFDLMPAKVVLADSLCAMPFLDPSVPLKKRVPQWAM